MSVTVTATSLYVYGVIPAAEAAGWPATEGLSSAAVHTVAEGPFAALVSTLPAGDTPGTRADIEAHRSVLSTAIDRGTTIPMRFGMVMADEQVVRERLLRKHAPELADLLRMLDGRVQLTVRGFYTEDALLRAVLADDQELSEGYVALSELPELATRNERIALGERVAKAMDERRALDERTLLDVLSPLAFDVRTDTPSGERGVVNAHLLVDRDKLHLTEAAIDELAKALSGYVALRLLGPLPPFSFSELSLEPETEQEPVKEKETTS
jgi:hypothetical protein